VDWFEPLQTIYGFLICGVINLLQNTNDDDDGGDDDDDDYYYYYQRPTVNMIVTIVTSVNFATPLTTKLLHGNAATLLSVLL